MISGENIQGGAGSVAKMKVILAGVCALVLSVGLARFSYTPMLPVMHEQAGLSVVMGGWLATWNYAGYMVGAFLAASIKKLESKFYIYRAGLLIALVTTLAMGLTHNPLVWGLLRFLSGMSSTAGLLLASGLGLNWLMRNGFKPELGLQFMGMGVGIMISGFAVEVMSDWLEWSGIWICLGLLGGIFFVFAWAWMPAPYSSPTAEECDYRKQPSRSWIIVLSMTYLCAGYGYVVGATFIVDIVHRLPTLTSWANWVWVLVGLAAVPTSFIWDRVARRWGIIQALVLAYTLQIFAILLPILSPGATCILVSAALFGSMFVGIVSLTLALVGRYYQGNPAKAMARLTLSYGVAQIAGPTVTAILHSRFGDYTMALAFAALVMFVGTCLLIGLLRIPVFDSVRSD